MQKPEQTSYLDPSYKKTSHGHHKIGGVQFNSYHTGILSYSIISSDGQIIIWSPNSRRDGAPTYLASIIGHGKVMGRGDSPKRFRSEQAACKEAAKIYRRQKD